MIILLISALGNKLDTLRAEDMNFLVLVDKIKKTTDDILYGSNIKGKAICTECWTNLQFTTVMTFNQAVQGQDLGKPLTTVI